ncbi:MAG: efflux RND transporter periplasmic adaptor subunit [Anaerolineae bacterium]|nr:efflux RND transporter periplasmic adaptor subunit [Anaerolineae bacterium]
MKRVLIILAVLAVVAIAGLWAWTNFVAKAEQPQQQREEYRLQRGTLAALVNTTGTILPEKQTTLSFRGTGRVAEVWVTEGQVVHAGQPLARLETMDLEASVAEAELALALTQAQLLRAQRPPSEYDLAAAQAAFESAQAAYQKLLAGPTKEEIQVARTNLDQAKVALDQAQAAYNEVADRPDVAMLPQALQLQQATISYNAAQASFNLTQRKPSRAELAAAKSAVAQAEATLARLQEGATAEDLMIAQLQVQQAQLRLEQARDLLASATLTAPHDGTITVVGVKQGELSGMQPAFVLTDLSPYHVDAMIDEIDVGRIAEGQPVTITLDALPGETLTGRIEQVAQTAQVDSGVVTYKATISLDPTTAVLRAGMTANADIVTERRDSVLLAPNRFIRVDRLTGKTFVDRLIGDQAQSIEIQIGLRDELASEVLAGLEEGDLIVLIKESTREQLQQTFMQP